MEMGLGQVITHTLALLANGLICAGRSILAIDESNSPCDSRIQTDVR
jgi:hypothetical protein